MDPFNKTQIQCLFAPRDLQADQYLATMPISSTVPSMTTKILLAQDLLRYNHQKNKEILLKIIDIGEINQIQNLHMLAVKRSKWAQNGYQTINNMVGNNPNYELNISENSGN